ncbi:hypothetical protein [Streptomyces radiopugnans]|uniref:Uncharacterized protein n=1 Tax=Streptomyces radiopugnans TaxID=403935 RepID=A0A1H9K5E4_9ACTN|nr:hypothetical protein [Streptomyces radiopugnans]SEQ94339.1 hypothetical protein SAMN05216481_1212 [Streptomyces radiopugnans]
MTEEVWAISSRTPKIRSAVLVRCRVMPPTSQRGQQWPDPAVQQVHFAQIRALFADATDVDGALFALDRAYREHR